MSAGISITKLDPSTASTRANDTAQPAIEARQLKVVRNKKIILKSVHVILKTGRWTAIVGPNGAGKSTLLHALAGLQPYQGSVFLQGDNLANLAPQARARRLSWLGQNEAVAANLKVADVVMLGRMPHQSWWCLPSLADQQAVAQALHSVNAWALRDASMYQLSGGERQRVLLARALAVQADVLLMDEPIAHLDPPHQADWLCIVKALINQGKTVVSVLHDMTLALHADDMLLLQQGEVRHYGASASAHTHRALEQIFDQRIAVHSLDGRWIVLPCC